MRRFGIIIALMAALLSGARGAEQPAKDEEIPLIEMREVLLTDAIRQLARMARLNVILDPKLSQAPYDGMTVSVRWEKVTAREALIALLDNYDLVLIESPPSRISRVEVPFLSSCRRDLL